MQTTLVAWGKSGIQYYLKSSVSQNCLSDAAESMLWKSVLNDLKHAEHT